MRYFQIRTKIVDSELPQLIVDGDSVDIEPKLHQLLLLFCRNPNVVISRDQIINEVNQGVVVSDNAVNKMVANLRQMLGDNPRQPQFIKTIPKQGYSFIAPVEPLEKPGSKEVEAISTPSSNTKFAIAALAILTVIIVLLLSKQQSPQSHEQSGPLVPLTRHSGVEFSPAISPDGRYLAYTRNDPANNIQQLWLADLKGDKPEQRLADLHSSGEIAWSSDSRKLMYTNYTDDICRFHQLEIVNFNSTPIELKRTEIAECEARFVRQLAYYDNDEKLLYTAYGPFMTPVQLYSLDLVSKNKHLINQPSLSGAGNYAFDFSDDHSKLLILSADESYKTTLHQLNLKENNLTQLSTWPRLLAHAIWHHDSETLVHTSNRFSHELIRSDINGNKVATLASTSNRVNDNFARHPNGKDFYFTSFMMNNDNVVIDLDDGAQYREFNSSVYDKLPTFGGSKDTWYFISKRGGFSQIFEADEKSKTTKVITRFTQESDVNGIDASPDGKTLVLRGQDSITLLNIQEGSMQEVAVESQGLLTASFLDNERIAISAQFGSQPGFIIYDRDKQTMQDAKWQTAIATPSGDKIYYIESATNAVYQYDASNDSFINTGIELPYVFAGGWVNAQVTDTHLVYGEHDNARTTLFAIDLTTGEKQNLGEWLFLVGFDARENRVVLSYEQSRSGDIVTTAFED